MEVAIVPAEAVTLVGNTCQNPDCHREYEKCEAY